MSNLKSKIESLLFISAKPMTVKQLSDLTKKEETEVRRAGDELVESYKDNKSGIQIIKNGSKFQMVSSPENTKIVQDFIQDETTGEISRPSLETLTIIAFRGPISKSDLDRIRGVNCSLILRNLLIRGLIEAKTDKLKEQVYYNVTLDFIRFLGINDVSELPDYEKLRKDDTIERVLEDDETGVSAKETAVNNSEFETSSIGEENPDNESASQDDDSIVLEISEENADSEDDAEPEDNGDDEEIEDEFFEEEIEEALEEDSSEGELGGGEDNEGKEDDGGKSADNIF